MQELLVIDAQFTEDQLLVFAKHKINLIKEGEIVNLVKVDKLRGIGKVGLIVSPYDNQWIIDKGFEKEVSFDKSRFTTLLGQPISEEDIEQELQDNKQKAREFVKITPKTNNPYDN